MSTEDLLKPRYKVIADYPMAFYGVGQVISCLRDNTARVLEGECWTIDLGMYPHLFRKLSWHEDRLPEEMPRFIKVPTEGDSFEYYEIIKWHGDVGYYNDNTGYFTDEDKYLPTTHEAFVNSKK